MAVYLVGDLLDIAIGNGLKLEEYWPKELQHVKWPWARNANGAPVVADLKLAAKTLDQLQSGLTLRDFLLLSGGGVEAPTQNPECSIIIPVFNHVDHTFECLRSVWNDIDLTRNEVIVIDNGSSDATSTMLRRLDGLVRVITNACNTGFGKACNDGAAAARGEYLLFLNNDSIVQPGWLRNLVSTVKENPEIGAAGSMLLYPNGDLQEAGGIVWEDGSAFQYGHGENPSNRKYQYAREVDYCSGASLLVRAELFHALGGFDERYSPAYYEDVDLCFGVRSLGFRVVYQPMSRAIHHEGVTGGKNTDQGYKRFQKINQGKFKAKWGEVLRRESQKSSLETVESAARQRGGPRVVVFDSMFAAPSIDAGSLRMTMILKAVAKWGRPQLSINGASLSSEAEEILAHSGVEIVELADANTAICPDDTSTVILSRPATAEPVLAALQANNLNVKVIYDTVDLHFVRLKRQAMLTGDVTVVAQMAQLREQEIRLASVADQVWCVTTADKEELARAAPAANIKVIPTIHALASRGKSFNEREGLLFIGNFNHQPNSDGIHYFMRDIFPRICVEIPQIRLYIVGSNCTDEIRAYDSEHVIVAGYVPNVATFFEGCRVFIAPLRFGAGMKGKIGQAFSFGLPTVTTAIGAEGIGVRHGREALIADDPQAFAVEVITLYKDQRMWQTLSDNCYQYIGEHYSPAAIEPKIVAALEELVADQGNVEFSPRASGHCRSG